MLRKFLRRVLPTHQSIRDNRYIARFSHRLHHHNLWHLHRRSVAGGIAVGMFAGLIPGSNPVQFSASAILAIRFKVNLPLSMLVTLYSNPLTIVPLYWLAFKIGQLALWQGGGEPPAFAIGLDEHGAAAWLTAAFHWLTGVGKPLLLGLPLLALSLTIVGYYVTDWSWRLSVMWQWRRRRLNRLKTNTP